MADIGSRTQRAISELTGNEALLGMLQEEAASAMLDWGIEISTSIVNETDGLDDLMADETLLPKLKAVRNSMRSIGNWAAGKYVEPESRVQLRDKLLEQFKIISGGHTFLPSPETLDDVLNQFDDNSNTQHQLVGKMLQLITDQN